ncbi:hypothetical protein JY97_07160 [Alkalispirochaeta odontotermitis]|nr:hypothetical protein JY97_07160 [Alkalispirochaeta odontotermitis]
MRIRFLKGWHRSPSKADVRVKQHLQRAMQRVDTALFWNSGRQHDMYPVYKTRKKTGFITDSIKCSNA